VYMLFIFLCRVYNLCREVSIFTTLTHHILSIRKQSIANIEAPECFHYIMWDIY